MIKYLIALQIFFSVAQAQRIQLFTRTDDIFTSANHFTLKNRKVMDVFDDESKGKQATTHFRVLERFRYVTLVECELETGRTHQIRVHMKSIGHPLFNDEEYGGDAILKGTVFTKYKQFVQNCFKFCNRQALHAYFLGIKHPISNKLIKFKTDYPKDIKNLLEMLGKY